MNWKLKAFLLENTTRKSKQVTMVVPSLTEINIIMLKIKIEESHYARLFLKLWCQTKIERRAQRSSKTCEICIKLP